MNQLYLTTHVGRDLLQTAGLFADVPRAVWEYVVNGLEYVDPGTSAVVHISIDKRSRHITISDNGRGMSLDGLRNYFILHGENVDRRAGRPGRGRFGTGKSAAFGIAESLRVTTTQNGKQCIAELSKREVRETDGGDRIPVRLIDAEAATSDANGTIVEISGVNKQAIDVDEVVKFCERQLCYWSRSARVFVNDKECVAPQPSVRFKRPFQPEGEAQDMIGDVVLEITVSKEYLEEHRRGIAISSNGVLHEIRPVEHNRYIFGSVDVPYLDSKTFAIPPFDASRSLKLNSNNPLVHAIHAFIDKSVKIVCREYDELEKKKRQTEESKKLDELGSRVSRVLNRHFALLRNRPPKSRSMNRPGIDGATVTVPGEGDGKALRHGGDISATIEPIPRRTIEDVTKQANSADQESRSKPPPLPTSNAGLEGAHSVAGNDRPSPNGSGFRVHYQNAGVDAHRAKYVSAERTIFVNVDHPQLAGAVGTKGVDSPSFQRFAYEIAFSEYALGLSLELAEQGQLLTPSETVDEIRETLNWLSRASCE